MRKKVWSVERTRFSTSFSFVEMFLFRSSLNMRLGSKVGNYGG
jgi:hypothetical protein